MSSLLRLAQGIERRQQRQRQSEQARQNQALPAWPLVIRDTRTVHAGTQVVLSELTIAATGRRVVEGCLHVLQGITNDGGEIVVGENGVVKEG